MCIYVCNVYVHKIQLVFVSRFICLCVPLPINTSIVCSFYLVSALWCVHSFYFSFFSLVLLVSILLCFFLIVTSQISQSSIERSRARLFIVVDINISFLCSSFFPLLRYTHLMCLVFVCMWVSLQFPAKRINAHCVCACRCHSILYSQFNPFYVLVCLYLYCIHTFYAVAQKFDVVFSATYSLLLLLLSVFLCSHSSFI